MQEFKNRILRGWTFTRILYFVIGAAILISSLPDLEWLGIFAGAYFSSMGLFAFGCASGQCIPKQEFQSDSLSNTEGLEVEFEEITLK